MNDTEAQRIAAAINCLRPDWPTASIRTTLTKPELMRRPRRDVAVALTWIACDSDSRTPVRVLETGDWWKAATVHEGESTFGPPRSSEACDVCNRHELSCICQVPVVDAEPRPDRPRGYSSEQRVPATDTWRAARAALRPETVSTEEAS